MLQVFTCEIGTRQGVLPTTVTSLLEVLPTGVSGFDLMGRSDRSPDDPATYHRPFAPSPAARSGRPMRRPPLVGVGANGRATYPRLPRWVRARTPRTHGPPG